MSRRRARRSCIGGAELATAARSLLWLEQVCRKSHLSATLQQRRHVNTSVMCSSTNSSCKHCCTARSHFCLRVCACVCGGNQQPQAIAHSQTCLQPEYGASQTRTICNLVNCILTIIFENGSGTPSGHTLLWHELCMKPIHRGTFATTHTQLKAKKKEFLLVRHKSCSGCQDTSQPLMTRK